VKIISLWDRHRKRIVHMQDYLSFVPYENPKIHHDYPQSLNSTLRYLKTTFLLVWDWDINGGRLYNDSGVCR
jgi:hypothetical protein